ncbi:MAG TPA: HRDC domain-containing protein [Solirubrobacteraceae bacterium]|nr:HRDC domain-containing protein [Solirubrobacteraceae bacterium]
MTRPGSNAPRPHPRRGRGGGGGGGGRHRDGGPGNPSSTLPKPDLHEIADAARAAGRIAFDTEFMGEGRYRTLLCLIQLAVPGPSADQGQLAQGERIELIDPLEESLDGSPLADVLADPAIQVVVHAGRQDVALVRRRFQTDVSNIFDTQIAAGFAGLPAQASYETLLARLLDVRVAKSASFTRWDLRPLSPEQLAYAREDVVHLLALAGELERRLRSLGRLTWAREECEPVARSTDERDLDLVFAKLPRVRGLSAPAQGIARELLDWRERLAADQDRPVQSILSDAALMEIAKRKPDSTERLAQIRGVNQDSLRRRGQDLLDAVARGAERPPEELPTAGRPPAIDAADPPLIALAEALVRARANEAGLAYELLASRADLQAIAISRRQNADEPDVRTLRGWRRELVGRELLELLDGRISLSVDRDGPAPARLRIV